MDDTHYDEYFSEDLCGHRRSVIVEIPSRQVVVRVEQHRRDEDVAFEGAYAIVKGDMESGKFGFVYFRMSGRRGPAGNISYLIYFAGLISFRPDQNLSILQSQSYTRALVIWTPDMYF